VKSGASTVRAASSRTSWRHRYISDIEFIELIHIINSYTKFIVLIHIINSLQASSTCLSMSTRISWHIGRQRYAKLIQRMQSPKGTYWKQLPCGLCFAPLKPWCLLFRPKKGWLVECQTELEPILNRFLHRLRCRGSLPRRRPHSGSNTLQSHIVFLQFFGQILTLRQDLAKVL
jgi:hypothetical protein